MADEDVTRMEKKLKRIYGKAADDISEKWDAYMKEAAEKLKPLETAYEKAKAGGDPKEIKKAGIALTKEKKLQTLQNERFKAMAEETAERITEVNRIAAAYVNDQMPRIYSGTYNETIGEIKTDLGKIKTARSFSLMDEQTAKDLATKNRLLFSQKTINKAKDKRWNLKNITSQITQGIMQGESVPKMAERLKNVSSMNETSAVRSARTLATTAENSGRMSGMKAAEERGIVYEKQWMASHDERTRESHAELDGVSVPLDEEFPNGLQYPGDMAGDPAEVWNCRCTMVRKLIGFRRADGSISEVDIKDTYDPDYFD